MFWFLFVFCIFIVDNHTEMGQLVISKATVPKKRFIRRCWILTAE